MNLSKLLLVTFLIGCTLANLQVSLDLPQGGEPIKRILKGVYEKWNIPVGNELNFLDNLSLTPISNVEDFLDALIVSTQAIETEYLNLGGKKLRLVFEGIIKSVSLLKRHMSEGELKVHASILYFVWSTNSKKYELAGGSIGSLLHNIYLQKTYVASEDLVAEVNANTKLWKAESYPAFENISLADFAKNRLGVLRSNPIFLPNETHQAWLSTNDVPESFDSRIQWPNCIHPIRDQQKCGSCWAFSGSEALSDRFCIANFDVNVVLSPQFMVSCDQNEFGCGGGYPDLLWKFLEEQGTTTDECVPYVSGKGDVPNCLTYTKCADGTPLKRYYAVIGSSRALIGPDAIKAEIFQNGPVQTDFTVYADFMAYKTGIYVHTTGAALGGHAVKIIGWGVEEGVPYWIIANSWTNKWGENGFFRIKFGEVGIDDHAIAGLADLDRH
eukprot:TRINITY_DN3038_c0_g1_i1.p1 TRINITY_DN3038_c0_g1~~TRINITY_DN3038_c0_g1_i1.p1  ORF type:complete len:441 (+),score=101.93 TRINITY_DN3038_c0_g1_i1:119-1441(+)